MDYSSYALPYYIYLWDIYSVAHEGSFLGSDGSVQDTPTIRFQRLATVCILGLLLGEWFPSPVVLFLLQAVSL